jgi:hypothetical protein
MPKHELYNATVRVKCDCGRKITFRIKGQIDVKVCGTCGRFVELRMYPGRGHFQATTQDPLGTNRHVTIFEVDWQN